MTTTRTAGELSRALQSSISGFRVGLRLLWVKLCDSVDLYRLLAVSFVISVRRHKPRLSKYSSTAKIQGTPGPWYS